VGVACYSMVKAPMKPGVQPSPGVLSQEPIGRRPIPLSTLFTTLFALGLGAAFLALGVPLTLPALAFLSLDALPVLEGASGGIPCS